MRKRLIGEVISDKMKKTRVVIYWHLKKHSKYHKFYKHRTKCYVHDEREESKVGDKVLIEQTRPLSKLKRWRLVKVLT